MQNTTRHFIFSFLAIIFCLFYTSVAAQINCKCNDINQQQTDELIVGNDSVSILSAVNKLGKSNDIGCQFFSFSLQAQHLLSKKKPAEALVIIQKQEKLIESSSCKDELQIELYLNYAGHYKVSQNYENLSLYAFKALELAETRNDKFSQFKAIIFIVHLFTRQNEEEKNWDYVKKGEKIVLGLPDNYTTAANYNWLAFEYERKFTLTERHTLLDTSLMYAVKAKEAALKLNDYTEIVRSYRVFESYAYNNGDLNKAIKYIDSAISFSSQIKISANPASLYFAKAWDYLDLKDYKEAERWQDTSLYYAIKLEGRSPATMSLYGEAAKLYETTGNLSKSYATFKMYEHIKDSVFKIQRSEKINELEQKYNKAKNEKTIKELSQQKRIYLLLALACLFAVTAIAFFLRQQKLKHRKDILETEQRLNRARMNPHFFFNALTTLQKFALRDNDGQALASNLSKFSNIMRETLESTYKEYVTVEQEMEFLNKYLEVQKIRFPKTFSYEVNADASLETDDILIPSMILQPFVENSIEHGFAGIDYPGNVTIKFKTSGKEVLIQINDNGKGLATTAKENLPAEQAGNEHISRASQIIKDRIYLLNIKLKTKAGFSIDNDISGKGVVVKIHLPLLYKSQQKA